MQNRKILLVFWSIVSLVLFNSYSGGPNNSTGSNYSGLPSGGSCNDCHSGGTGNGNLQLQSSVVGNYAKSTPYTISVTLTDPEIVIGGFSLSAVDENNMPIGIFTAINSTHTFDSGASIEHTAPQTAFGNSCTWVLTWTSPSSGNGTVSFYCAANAANNSGDNSGDDIYLGNLAAVPLPIELSNFKAQKRQDKVNLAWEIANQSNFSNFEIQKSIDTKHFMTVGKIDLQTQSNLYSFDDDIYLNAETVYYRLKMNDKDSRSSFSKIISVKITSNHEVKVFPNPASTFINIDAEKNVEDAIIMDSFGNLNILSINNNNLDLSNFENGIYSLILKDGTVRKFEVLH